ncbi:MAG: DUF2232 domain-containing protein [Clostridia bacterium]
MQWIRGKEGAAWLPTLVIGWGLALWFVPVCLAWPFTALLVPALLCWAERRSGMVATALLALVTLAVAGRFMGVAGLAAAALVLLPSVGVTLLLQRRSAPFWQSIWYVTLALLVGGMAALWIVYRALGQSPVKNMVEIIGDWIEQSDQKVDILLMAHSAGLARTLEKSMGYHFMGMQIPNVVAQNELMQTLLASLTDLLDTMLPGALVTGAMTGGLCAVALPRFHMVREMDCVDPPPVVAVEKWFIPYEVGQRMFGLVAICLFLSLMQPNLFALPFQIVWEAVSLALALQGAAVGMHLLRTRGMRPVPRTLLLLGSFLLLRMVCVLTGMMDQWMDLRGLRPHRKKTNPFHPSDDDDDGEEDDDKEDLR